MPYVELLSLMCLIWFILLCALSLLKFALFSQGGHPTAIVALTDAINGNRLRSDEDPVCDVCAARKPKKCQGCLQTYYCSKECQKANRPSHKRFCKKSGNPA